MAILHFTKKMTEVLTCEKFRMSALLCGKLKLNVKTDFMSDD